ncbi:chemotaxis protein CheB [Nannocystaceae bacterium ST9]
MLVVDDSSICREVLIDILERDHDIEVVGEAASGEQALDRMASLAPDVITLDIQMPGMGGLAAIEAIMARQPKPILVVTGLDTRERDLAVEATRRGALALANKVSDDDPVGAKHLRESVRRLAAIEVEDQATIDLPTSAHRVWPTPAASSTTPILAFGCSAGGPKALAEVLDALPRDLPASIAIANHLPADFVSAYARLLWTQHRFPVALADTPLAPEPGTIVLAPGGCDLVLVDGHFVGQRSRSDALWCPRVDLLFESVAAAPGAHVGVVLSGLGSDGARGLSMMRARDKLTLVQSQRSASVWGMPNAAVGSAVEILATAEIPRTIVRWLELRAPKKSS